MTLHGKIHNGMVVFDGSPDLPEGAAVTVEVAPVTPPPRSGRLSDEELRRRNAIMDAIAALPDENPGDNFSGRDHDKALYGEP